MEWGIFILPCLAGAFASGWIADAKTPARRVAFLLIEKIEVPAKPFCQRSETTWRAAEAQGL